VDQGRGTGACAYVDVSCARAPAAQYRQRSRNRGTEVEREPHAVTVALVDVRRLAALDMHGLAGSSLRRRFILAEFVLGAAGCVVVGLLTASRASGAGWRVFGVWLAGIGVNYVALAVHAVSLSRSGTHEAELAGVDVASELRRYTYLQAWTAVPLLLAALTLLQVRGRASPVGPD